MTREEEAMFSMMKASVAQSILRRAMKSDTPSEYEWTNTYAKAICEKMYETEDAFVLEIVQPYVNEIMHRKIPKEVIRQAILTYSREHSEEMKRLMEEYGED